MLASNGMRPGSQLARELLSPLSLALALLFCAMFFAHDPRGSSLAWIGAGALLLAGVLFARNGAPAGMAAFLPLAGLGIWCAITIAWSQDPDRSWSYTNRTLVCLAFAVLGALLGEEPRRLLYGLGLLLGVVCVWALLGKV